MNGIALSTLGYISISQSQLAAAVQACPLPPVEAQKILIKALELPLPPSMTEALGIFQSDIIIRSAIIAAIADLRANPWLLEYVFASLPRDPLTMNEYGEQEVAQAKKWFTTTNIPVVINVNPNEVKFPCISIALMSSNEDTATLSDVHYQTVEGTDSAWPILAGPVSPIGYNAGTGILSLKSADLGNLILAPKMIVVDKVGKEHEILDVIDEHTVQIKAGTVADFSGLLIKGEKPMLVTELESVIYREAFAIGCHVDSEPVHLTYLHSILVFCLLRYKQALLEARGFERSALNSSELKRDDETLPEMIYSRYVQVTGYIRQYWPKTMKRRVVTTVSNVVPVGGEDCTPSPVMPHDPIQDIEDSDSLGGLLKLPK